MPHVTTISNLLHRVLLLKPDPMGTQASGVTILILIKEAMGGWLMKPGHLVPLKVSNWIGM